MAKWAKSWGSIAKCAKITESVLKAVKVCLKLRKCAKRKPGQECQKPRKYEKVQKSGQKCARMRESVQKGMQAWEIAQNNKC